MTLSAGSRLGPYVILGPLGAGGMGEVYRARDTRLDRDVAIKVLPEAVARDPAALSRFGREAKALAALSHPNVLGILDIGQQDGVAFAVMELLDGETLRARLSTIEMPWRESVEIAIAMAEGLAAAHSRGIVHRDLKPENVFLTSDGRVKILDFGLARRDPLSSVGNASVTPTLTQQTMPGTVIGTIGYMAPEQVSGDPGDARSDIFSFGCVLYEMATGRRAFQGKSGGETLAAILRDDPEDPMASGRAIPQDLARVIAHCLAREPAQRFQSAQDLAFNLRAVAVSTVSAPVPPTPKLRRVGLVVAALILLAALIGVLIATRQRSPAAPSVSADIRSLAVLPLANLSHDPEQEYFADGMTEELITDLAQIRSLRVISRTSVMAYKGTKKPLPQIGRELNADAILEGSVQRSGERVRINAQLVHAATDRHLWARSYERDLRDVLALQSDVARAVASEIRAAVTPQEAERLAKVRPVDPEAHELFLKGRYYWNKRTERDVLKSVEYFEQAIEKDPAYALAYAGLSDGWLAVGFYEGLAPREAFPRAKAAATKALEIDDGLAEAHGSLGMVNLFFDWNWPVADAEFKRTLELNANYPTGHHWRGEFLSAMGRGEEAVAEARRARELDPLSLIINAWVGRQLYFSRRYDEAITEFRKALELDANFVPAHWQLGSAYVQKGQYPEAVAEFQEAVRLTDGSPRYLARLAHVLALMGNPQEARKLWDRLAELSKRRNVSSYNFAVVALGLGERDRALGLLEKAFDERSSQMCFLNVEPLWDPLRPDPRFREVLRRVGFTL